MKSNVKIMLLGMTLALIGIHLRCILIGNLHSAWVEYVWVFLPSVGILIALYGFFRKDKDET